MDEFELFTVVMLDDSKIRIEFNCGLEELEIEPKNIMSQSDTELIYEVVCNVMTRLKECMKEDN